MPSASTRPALLRLTSVVDALGGLGLVLPGLARRRPGLAAWDALGVVLLQVCAIGFHLARGERANAPFNFAGLALFVFWGRRKGLIYLKTGR